MNQHCSRCGCAHTGPSRFRSWDVPALILGFLPFRCRVCFRRFFAWRFALPA